ncbi:MAG: histone deacetylase [Ignavibacteria bacterium]
MSRIGFVFSEKFLDHRTPQGHPERPERLRRLVAFLQESGLWQKLTHLQPCPASEEQLLAVHTLDHIRSLKEICANGEGWLDEGDTYAVRESYEAAFLASGAVVTAIDAVMWKNVDAAFCAVRPPGHHAERDRAMGFCLFNNVAVGARHAQRAHGVERVAILDWDVHHGNGTQHIFEADSTVLYISLHQYPCYPGTGARDERGVGAGTGYTLNIPLPAGTGQERYLQAFHEEILPALHSFAPHVLIVSAGFDAHRDDPLASMKLTERSYEEMTRLIKNIAPIVSVLEGGYNLDALAQSAAAHIQSLGDLL